MCSTRDGFAISVPLVSDEGMTAVGLRIVVGNNHIVPLLIHKVDTIGRAPKDVHSHIIFATIDNDTEVIDTRFGGRHPDRDSVVLEVHHTPFIVEADVVVIHNLIPDGVAVIVDSQVVELEDCNCTVNIRTDAYAVSNDLELRYNDGD